MNPLSLEEVELLGDSKYRAYISQVEKTLRNFESTSEWADLIAALGKLNKVLSAHVRYPVIPKRVTIGKRLAQCLHPALPSGVHIKALETYDIIFKCIGMPRLSADLFTYSAGLFPLLAYAAMNVKPALLSLYEAHFVPLGKNIKPALTGLLLGLLPGLEEGSESFDRTAALLDEFCEVSEPVFFYTCLWECVLSSPGVRLAAINYVLMRLNKKQSLEDQLYLMGSDIDLLVSALCLSVQDTSVLVQRSGLELLLTALPMHNEQLTRPDKVKLVTAAIKVLLRRDMSLNRRLYAWLLGTDASGTALPVLERSVSHSSDTTAPDTDHDYFHTYSRDLLVEAVKNCIKDRTTEETAEKNYNLRPFRILISLLDRPEIGSPILEDILMDIFRYMYRECMMISGLPTYQEASIGTSKNRLKKPRDYRNKTEEKTLVVEVVKTANLLFGTFEPFFIWEFIGRAFEKSCSAKGDKTSVDYVSIAELCNLVHFLLDKVSLETCIETQTEYLPALLRTMTVNLTNHCEELNAHDMTLCLKLCSKVLSHILPSMTFISTNDLEEPSNDLDAKSNDLGSSSNDVDPPSNDLEHSINNVDASTNDLDPSYDNVDLPNHIDAKSSKEKRTSQDESVEKGQLPTVAEHDSSESPSTDVKKSEVIQPETADNNFTEDAFQDYVHYEGKPESVPETTAKPTTLMQACVESYHHLFYTLVRSAILPDMDAVRVILRQLKQSGGETESREVTGVRRLVVGQLDPSVCEAFSAACQLLVEFSSFPMYCTNCQQALTSSFTKDLWFSDWLQLLLTCACFLHHFTITSVAVTTLLDLITLTQSVVAQGEVPREEEEGRRNSHEGTVSVVIIPAISPSHLNLLNTSTHFYAIVATNLWGYLGESTPSYHGRSVELLHNLLQLAPRPNLCEDVLGNALLSEDKAVKVEAFRRFVVLWHLLRDKTPPGVSPGKPTRMFDRSMFTLLDSLQSDSHPCIALSQTWLRHAVQRGDISRLLDPILLILLHPDTARISIQHVQMEAPKRLRLLSESSEESETHIYAISSEGGNVIYHVNKSQSRATTDQVPRTSTLTSIREHASRAVTTEKTKMEPELNFDRVNPTDVNVHINPFVGSSSEDRVVYENPPSQFPNMDNVKRLSAETCLKEGIFFDDMGADERELTMEVQEEGTEETEPEAVVIVRAILDELINEIERREEPEEEEEVSTEVHEVDECEVAKELEPEPRVATAVLTTSESGTMSDSDMDTAVDDTTIRKHSSAAHPLHNHILLYGQRYDTQRTLYALKSLKSILVTYPRLVISTLTTTNISSSHALHHSQILSLLIRHRRAIFGKNFYSEYPPEATSSFHSTMYIEVLISLCLYLLRSYYPNLLASQLQEGELAANRAVQVVSCELLTQLVTQLSGLIADSSRGVATYINDVLSKCRLQKVVLHCLLATIHPNTPGTPEHLSESIMAFNQSQDDADETFLISLLRLVSAIIVLEDRIAKCNSEGDLPLPVDWETTQVMYRQAPLVTDRYINGRPLVYQKLLLAAVVTALKQQHNVHTHSHWLGLVSSSLPYLSHASCPVIVNVTNQLCRNIESLSHLYEVGSDYKGPHAERIPPDHMSTLLESLTTLCHYCLLDSSQQQGGVGQTVPPSPAISTTDTIVGSQGDKRLLSNIISALNPGSSSKEGSTDTEALSSSSPLLTARRHLLTILPRILSALAILWKSVRASEEASPDQPAWTMGTPKMLRKVVLDFISPICVYHAANLLAATSVVWNDRRPRTSPTTKRVIPLACEEQQLLVDMIGAVKVLPTDTLITTVKHVVKSPPTNTNTRRTPVEVSLLQFFFAYIQRTPGPQLVDSWPALLSLLRDALQISLIPPAHFLLLGILNEFVQKITMFEDRKDIKDLQEICQKLLEATGEIAGSSLEQTTFFRRNLAVKPGPQIDVTTEMEDTTTDQDTDGESARPPPPPTVPHPSRQTSLSYGQYSVQALVILAELTATLLDVVYRSEEKDRVVPLLNTLMYNVFPYLRNHSPHNLPSFRACSQLLASLSSYTYTRKAWRKEAFELLLDPAFFQMDQTCIGLWRVMVDNLMAQDKTTFKDLLGRVTLTQGTSLNLFSSREQEIELRAQLLKRLSFTIFCSEVDQYHRSMPEIQERLSESLRLTAVPTIQAQVFLCIRVLIMRVSPHHLTSLWPSIITELVHVLLQIEQDLLPEMEDNRSKMAQIANLDPSWAYGNGLVGSNQPSYLRLYLAACKLLDLALALPSDSLPQFQLYRWAFVGDTGSVERGECRRFRDQVPVFSPHVIRIAQLMNHRYNVDSDNVPILKTIPGRPLLTAQHINSVRDLYPFFSTVASQAESHSPVPTTKSTTMTRSRSAPSIFSGMTTSSKHKSSRAHVEAMLEMDFLEQMPQS